MKGKMAIIGSGDSVLAFKAGGVDAYDVDNVEIAKEVKKRGAALMNVLPLIPLGKLKHYPRPDCSMMEKVRDEVEEIIPVF